MTNNRRKGAVVIEKNGRPFSVGASNYLMKKIQRGRRHCETKNVF